MTLVVDGVELGLLELALARTSRSWPATRRAHTLARYSARCSVAIAAGAAEHIRITLDHGFGDGRSRNRD